jgi:hypothetical protein
MTASPAGQRMGGLAARRPSAPRSLSGGEALPVSGVVSADRNPDMAGPPVLPLAVTALQYLNKDLS